MTPTQRRAALRLADALTGVGFVANDLNLAAALLRELAAEQLQKPVAWMAESKSGTARFTNIGQSADELESLGWAIVPLYAAPQQPMRCPKDGGECGAGGYCRPEPVQRRPLSDAFVYKVVRSVQPNLADTCKAWAEQFYECKYWLDAAHGITGEQK